MGIDVCRGGQVGVSEEGRYIQQRHVLIDEDAGESVPLRYNYDKPEKPRINKVAIRTPLFNRVPTDRWCICVTCPSAFSLYSGYVADIAKININLLFGVLLKPFTPFVNNDL